MRNIGGEQIRTWAAEEGSAGMIEMMNVTSPRDEFLQSVWRALSAKRRSLRHRGDLEIQVGADQDGEWLRISFKRATGPIVVIEVLDRHFANVFLQSARRADRNKMLYRREGLRLIGNGNRVFDAIDRTFREAEYSSESHRALDRAWKPVLLEIVRDA